jgi:adenylate cyclase
MSSETDPKETEWRHMLMEGERAPRNARRIFRLLPSNPRCKLCNAPFKSWGGSVMRMIGRPQSKKNPHYCEPCEFQEPGGAEVVISMLFADIRGSTSIAEKLSPSEFSSLIANFYETATNVLIQSDALIDRLVGDEVIGLFIPGFAGSMHSGRAIEAAQVLLRRLGYDSPNAAPLPVGIGIHTGLVFVGVVKGGEEKVSDFTALGDNVNIAARLASAAGAGEILVSEAAIDAAQVERGALEYRKLSLKGKSEQFGVYVYRNPQAKHA